MKAAPAQANAVEALQEFLLPCRQRGSADELAASSSAAFDADFVSAIVAPERADRLQSAAKGWLPAWGASFSELLNDATGERPSKYSTTAADELVDYLNTWRRIHSFAARHDLWVLMLRQR